MLKIRVGGVPEHFNLPWYLANESGILAGKEVELQWKDFPGGTGAMNQALREDELDLAVILTEGFVTDITNGNPCKILKVYVESPLIWGVHVAEDRVENSISEIQQPTYAISRYGSGSHLMAILHAQENGITVSNMNFRIVDSLQGALDAFQKGLVDIFFWEKFTTAPYCQTHAIKLIEEYPTPWPCFVLAVNPTFYEQYSEKVEELLEAVFSQASSLKKDPSAVSTLSARYNLEESQVEEWLKTVSWGQNTNFSEAEVGEIAQQLKQFGIIENGFKSSDFLI